VNILVVGGAGYVGGGIVDKLKQTHNVTVYDSLIYEESYRKDVNFVYGDIRDHDKLLRLLKANDAVIWLAALVGDGACSINPELTFEINSESVKFLANNFDKKLVLFMGLKKDYWMSHHLLIHYLNMLLQKFKLKSI
jgi:nucleoside-diphosphate-sugar epimerase